MMLRAQKAFSVARSSWGCPRSLTTKASSTPLKDTVAKPRRLVTSARILPDGYIKPALYDENTPIPRCESCSASTYHTGVFPWLLSAERQRVPLDDLQNLSVIKSSTTSAAESCDHQQNVSYNDNLVSAVTGAAAQLVPLAGRRQLAHMLNMRIARGALGEQALEDVCQGASAALPHVAQLLSAASNGSSEASGELCRVFSRSLLARYRSALDKLQDENIELNLEVGQVNSAQILQLRTQTGPAEAFDALAAATEPVSPLRAGLVRRGYKFTNAFGALYAAPHTNTSTSTSTSSSSGSSPMDKSVRVRVDVELNVDMRYRLVEKHKARSEYDRHDGDARVVVDDNATRNLVLTLQSTSIPTSSSFNEDGRQPSFQWRVADIDYLLSSEQRVQQELEEARSSW